MTNQNSDPGPGGGRRDKRDDGCWFKTLKAALVAALVVWAGRLARDMHR